MNKDLFNDEELKEMLENLREVSSELPEAAAILDAINRLGDEAEDEDFDSILSEITGILGDMKKKYGVLNITDEEGNEHTLEILGRVNEEDEEYLVVTPVGEEDSSEDGEEAYVLHLIDVDENGAGSLEFVEDDETCDRILDKFYEEYGEEDDEK